MPSENSRKSRFVGLTRWAALIWAKQKRCISILFALAHGRRLQPSTSLDDEASARQRLQPEIEMWNALVCARARAACGCNHKTTRHTRRRRRRSLQQAAVVVARNLKRRLRWQMLRAARSSHDARISPFDRSYTRRRSLATRSLKLTLFWTRAFSHPQSASRTRARAHIPKN